MKCRFGDKSPAVGVWRMNAGCVCYPDDLVQALCAQHAYKAEPLGPMKLIKELT